MARLIFPSWRTPYELTPEQAVEVEAAHKVTSENVYAQYLVPVEGQTDILTMGPAGAPGEAGDLRRQHRRWP